MSQATWNNPPRLIFKILRGKLVVNRSLLSRRADQVMGCEISG